MFLDYPLSHRESPKNPLSLWESSKNPLSLWERVRVRATHFVSSLASISSIFIERNLS